MMINKMKGVIMITVALTMTMTDVSASHHHHHGHQKTNSQHHLRADFVKAMDRAMGKNIQHQRRIQRHETFLSKLAEVATPVLEAIPGYYDEELSATASSSSSSIFDFGFVHDVIDNEVLPESPGRNLEEWQGYGVNLTDYALKYIGCSNIKTWSDEMAQNGGNNNNNNNGNNNNKNYNSNTVLKTERFVVLRLCPRDECSNYNRYGCMERYGDYVIPMDIYLQIMAETFFAQYQEYCETCSECMAAFNNNNNNNNANSNNNAANDDANANANGDDANYNNNNNGGGRHRQLYDDAYYNNNAANDDANNGAANDDGANGDDFYNYYQNNANQNGGCEYYAVCENYESACDDYSYVANDLEQYFGCAEFYIGDNVGYLGPHCKSDGKTIALGIFHDENCYQYNADLNEMSNYMAVSDNDLAAYYSKNCISCLASVRC
jgi:hypothetical protein